MTTTTDDDQATCDRCGATIGPLEPTTNIQFSGGVDALRTACHDCVQELVAVWNDGDAVDAPQQ